MSYQNFIQRNLGYIDLKTQEKIKNSHILIAGCGIGSSPAISLARMGFTNFRLVDPDTVDEGNLNRQFFDYSDIGKTKVEALKQQILSINPKANVEAIPLSVSYDNASKIVSGCDFIIDSIDFISLSGILSLHDEVKKQNLPCLTVLSLGWGAGGMYFPKDSKFSFRQAFSIPENDQLLDAQYGQYFAPVFEKLVPHIDDSVVKAMANVIQQMKEGKPCPAPQVSSGSWACGHLAAFIAHRNLAGALIPEAPEFIIYNPMDTFEKTLKMIG